jgi:serine/threonine protein kinase
MGLATFSDGDSNEDSNEGIHKSNVGTPFYMAPEISNGHGYSSSIDIYSAGIIYFELLRNFKTN